ncbi:hypothetical protein RQM65_13800 [Pricia sp. S334]|uniref:Uncharacterized protein n=1 Tax=Pricia mediterranea TaxID=3076079 RepID=A0ABU3L859_9FLAO|nr:hypothetical protein [Pricia sp. S334]MDT7829743.1 hypothetical protein [Pricia sp. S334]
MPPSFKNSILVLAGILSLNSCVNLKHVNKFAQSSVEGIEQYDSLASSFTEICYQNCEQEHIRQFKIHDIECECGPDRRADSITRLIYTTTKDYFYGLSDLSQNELTKYQADDFTQTLATGNFGPLEMDEADVKAYSDISTLLLRATTDAFRRKKLKQYVTQAHGPLLKLLHFLELNLTGSLNGKLEVQKSELKDFYFDFIMDKQLSDYERIKFAEDYFRRTSEIEAQQETLSTYAEVLREMVEGHTILYSNIGNMTDDEVRKTLGRHGRKLHGKISSFKTKE